MKNLLAKAPRFLFFTGKGGVGKTSMACTTAVGLAEMGKRILLISTDPASNLDEVLDTKLGSTPTEVNGVSGLYAMNINPIDAAAEDMALLEEELRSPCIEEIAVFQAFAQTVAKGQDKFIVLDTAPTGHTLLLLR